MKTSKDFVKKLNEPITQKKLNFADWFVLFCIIAFAFGALSVIFLSWL